MLRRSFRMGLRLGLLGGIAAAGLKMVKSWRAGNEPPDWVAAPSAWPAQPAAAPAAPKAAPAPIADAAAPIADATSPEPQTAVAPVAALPDPAVPAATVTEAPVADIAVEEPAAPSRPAAKPKRERPLKAAPAPPAPGAPSTTARKAPAKKAAAPAPGASATWVEPSGALCPQSHPVKAKLSSKLFHLPGMLAYERTKPDRCYADEAAAEADGLTRAKR